MATPESVHKVQSNSEDRGIKGQDLPPQHHAGQVGYGPNYHPEPVAMFPESYEFVDTESFTDNSREDQGAERRTRMKGQTRSRVDQAWPRYS